MPMSMSSRLNLLGSFLSLTKEMVEACPYCRCRARCLVEESDDSVDLCSA